MKASGLTNWGAFLIGIRGMCAGVLWGGALRGSALGTFPGHWLILGAVAGMVASGIITPVIRALGWRGLVVHVGDTGTAPSAGDVVHALRSSLGDGLSLQEAVRFLHLNRGWDVLHLYPAVATVANIPSKDAIRLVLDAMGAAESGTGSPVV